MTIARNRYGGWKKKRHVKPNFIERRNEERQKEINEERQQNIESILDRAREVFKKLSLDKENPSLNDPNLT